MCMHQNQHVQIDPFADRYIPSPKSQSVMDKCDKNVWVIANITPITNYNGLNLLFLLSKSHISYILSSKCWIMIYLGTQGCEEVI